LSEAPPPSRNQSFQIGELVRLNEELKQLREILKLKKAEREKAKREGRKLRVDLSPEIERLARFLTDLERVKSQLGSGPIPGMKGKLAEKDALGNVLSQVQSEIENEKKKLEEERTAREQERIKHEQELQLLKDEVKRNRELLDGDRKALENLVIKRLEQSQKLQPEPSESKEAENAKNALPTVKDAREAKLERTADELSEAKRKELEEVQRRIEEEKRTLQSNVTDEFSAIRLELQRVREQISREQYALEMRRQDLDFEKHRMEENKRMLETRLSDEFSTTRSELQRLREQVSREQEALETKRKELYEEKQKHDEEKRTLEMKNTNEFAAMRSELQALKDHIAKEQEILEAKRIELMEEKHEIDEQKKVLEIKISEIEDHRIRYVTRRAMEEVRSERSELNNLKRSLQQLRGESSRDRKRLEQDREAILKARLALENEKRKIAWKNALLQIKARSVALQKTGKRDDKHDMKQLTRSAPDSPLEEATASPASEGAVVLGVRLGDQDYGIDIGVVREIMTKRMITPVPRQPSYVEGVMNVRGTIIPVINLRKRFDLKGEFPQNPNTVIVESGEGLVGILVDSVSEVIRVPQDRIHPPPAIASGMDGEYLRGICRLGDQLLLYLDINRILKKATPVAALYSDTHIGPLTGSRNSFLNSDERKLLNAVSADGVVRTRLMRRIKFSDGKFSRIVSSLSRKGLIKVSKDGNRRIVRRIVRSAT